MVWNQGILTPGTYADLHFFFSLTTFAKEWWFYAGNRKALSALTQILQTIISKPMSKTTFVMALAVLLMTIVFVASGKSSKFWHQIAFYSQSWVDICGPNIISWNTIICECQSSQSTLHSAHYLREVNIWSQGVSIKSAFIWSLESLTSFALAKEIFILQW